MKLPSPSPTFLVLLAFFLLALPVDEWLYYKLLPISNSQIGTLWAHAADYLGNGFSLIIFSIFIALFNKLLTKKDFKRIVVSCSVAVALSGVAGYLLKVVIGRPRPGMELPSWQIDFFNMASDFHSFPSGHAAASFSIAFCLCYFIPRLQILWLGSAMLISLGRVVGQAHFLTDVVAGAIIGFLCANFTSKGDYYKILLPQKFLRD